MNGLLIATLIAVVFVVLAFVVFASRADRTLSITPREAQDIMKLNFFDLDDAYTHLGIVIQDEWDRALRRVPFTREVLEECKSTHVLVAIPPISILHMRTIATTAHFYEDKSPWYLTEPFAQEEGKLQWKLIRKTPVPCSTMCSAMEQRKLLFEDEIIPLRENSCMPFSEDITRWAPIFSNTTMPARLRRILAVGVCAWEVLGAMVFPSSTSSKMREDIQWWVLPLLVRAKKRGVSLHNI
jgi:hypothetical protein